jgi:hypothetical protein
LVTSALTPADLDAVRAVASDRTPAATVVAHVFSWIGSGFVVSRWRSPAASRCIGGGEPRRWPWRFSTVGAQVIIDLDKLLVGRPRPPCTIWTW